MSPMKYRVINQTPFVGSFPSGQRERFGKILLSRLRLSGTGTGSGSRNARRILGSRSKLEDLHQ